MVPAGTILTRSTGASDLRGGIGLSIADGELCICISDDGTHRTMVARLSEEALQEFCGLLADHLAALNPADEDEGAEVASCTLRH